MKIEMNEFDEERIGRLLRLLPPAPEGWVLAAQELPAARAVLDELVARAEQDAVFRLQLPRRSSSPGCASSSRRSDTRGTSAG